MQSARGATQVYRVMHGDHVNIAKATEFNAALTERIILDRAETDRWQPPTVAPPAK
jgi:hypothetical protein